jgi:hypothetical protein
MTGNISDNKPAQERANTVRMPTVVRSLAANWGQPSSAPVIPLGGKEFTLPQRTKVRDVRGPAQETRSARERSDGYAKTRREDMFGM